MELSKAFKGFVISRDDLSPTTIDIYTYAMNLMIDYLQDKPVEKITSQDLHLFFHYLRTEYQPKRMNQDTSPLSERSIENIWTAMRSFWNYASEEFGVPRVDHAIKRPRYTPRQIEIFTMDECRRLLACAERTRVAATNGREAFTMRRPTAVRDRALITTLLDTGIRASECARLTLADVDLDAGEVLVQPFGTGRKTKSRTTYLGRAARKSIWRYLNQRSDSRKSDPLFLTIEDRPMNRNSIRLVFNELGDRAEIPHCHPHRCRHTFCYNYIKNGGDPFTLCKIAGFSLDMAMTYVHMCDLDAKAAHVDASPVDTWRL